MPWSECPPSALAAPLGGLAWRHTHTHTHDWQINIRSQHLVVNNGTEECQRKPKPTHDVTSSPAQPARPGERGGARRPIGDI